jgi:NADH-quinone oxidoreductase subunit J
VSVLAADVNVAQNVGFYIIAAAMVWGALRVVTTRNVVHAALWLIVVLGGIAAQYILAAAEFVAVSQVLIYIGAVMVLFLFGIMLTRATVGPDTDLNNKGWAIGIPVALGLLGVLGYVVIDVVRDDVLVDRDEAQIAATTTAISDAYIGDYLVSRSCCSPPRSVPSSWRGRTERCTPRISCCSARCCSRSACSA